MKVYHGTSQSALPEILTGGIKPRGDAKSHWIKCPSRGNRVYLTECYGPYYAWCASQERGAVLEIDTDKLDAGLFGTDEDIVAQVYELSNKALGKKSDIFKLVNSVEMEQFDQHWRKNFELMGTFSYKGVVPPEAITRYVTLDFPGNVQLEMWAMDTSVSIVNFKLLRENHVKFTRWLFGEENDPYGPEIKQLQRMTGKDLPVFPRAGVKLFIPSTPTHR